MSSHSSNGKREEKPGRFSLCSVTEIHYGSTLRPGLNRFNPLFRNCRIPFDIFFNLDLQNRSEFINFRHLFNTVSDRIGKHQPVERSCSLRNQKQSRQPNLVNWRIFFPSIIFRISAAETQTILRTAKQLL